MRNAELEDRSLTELRALAQAMGAKFAFADDKSKIIANIREHMAAKVPKPRIPDLVEPSDQSLIIVPPKYVCTQKQIVDALQPYTLKGLVIRFPTEDQWMLSCGKKEDSGTLRMPLLDVVRCARDMVR
jgi:hypothetical protein